MTKGRIVLSRFTDANGVRLWKRPVFDACGRVTLDREALSTYQREWRLSDLVERVAAPPRSALRWLAARVRRWCLTPLMAAWLALMVAPPKSADGQMTLAPMGFLLSIIGRSQNGPQPPTPGGGGGGGNLHDWVAGTTIEGASLPTTKLTTTFNIAAQGGTVHRCDTSAEIDTAITNCARGDIIVAESNTTFDKSTTRSIPSKTGTGWVYFVAGDIYDSLFPKAPGQRVASTDLTDMATFRSTSSNTPVFTVAHGASHATHWRFVGLAITTTQGQQQGLVEIQGDTATTANLPEWIGFDRCLIYGVPGTTNVRRGIRVDGQSIFVIDCDIYGIRDAADSDSQAIAINHGAGPLRVINTRLQSASENFMSGGASSFRQPADLEFGYCHFEKLEAWNGVYPVKNNFEIKFATRVYVYGSHFERCWTSGQTGPAIVVKSTSQTGVGDGAQYASTNIIFDHCLATEFQIPFHIFGSTEDSTQDTDNVVLRQCVFVKQRSGDGQGYYISTGSGSLNGVVTKNCTIESNQTYWHHNVDLGASTPKGDSFTFEDNLLEAGLAASWTGGPFGASGGIGGTTALSTAFTSYSVTKNAIRGDWTANVASGNTMSTATTWANIFTDYAGGDYSIATGNWAEGVGTGGADPGADWTAVSDAIQYTSSGQRPSEV